MPHAAFVLPDMTSGGAERLTIDLMEGFLQRGARVDLVLQTLQGKFLELVPEGVRVIDLAAPRLRSVVGPLRDYLRRERPDALLAAMWPLTSVAVLAARWSGHRPRLVLSDHCPLAEQYARPLTTRLSLEATMAATYRFADGIIAVSRGLAGELAQLAHIAPERVTTVWNPVPPPLVSGAQPWGDAPGPRILSVGKLKAEKRHDLLVRAFARVAAKTPATLAIVGEGTHLGAIQALVTELGLEGRVLLPGFTSTPGDWYAGADLFVLASDYEGFGNVMVEAMHCGLPVVATDCPYGPAEALGGGRWGSLVPCGDEAALASALEAALAAPADAQAQRARAAEFSASRAVDAYWRAMMA